MTSFGQELLGSCEFSLIPPNSFYAIISTNLWLLLSTKSVVAYVRKQSRFAIFEWQTKEKGWYLYAGEYPTGWEKKVKVVNLSTPTKKGSVSQSAKPKSTKKGDDSSETSSDIIPYEGGLPPIGNIVLKGSPPFARTHSSKHSTTSKPKPWMLLLAGPTAVRERYLHQLHMPLPRGEYVICKLCLFFLLLIHRAFLRLTPHAYLFISLLPFFLVV